LLRPPPEINTKICGRRGGDTNWSIRCMHARGISLQPSWVAAILPDSVLDVPAPVLKNRSDMQCLLWILKRERLRQIYSVCCGSWRENNFDKSAVFDVDLKREELRQICSVVVDLEVRRTSTNLQCSLWILKREVLRQICAMFFVSGRRRENLNCTALIKLMLCGKSCTLTDMDHSRTKRLLRASLARHVCWFPWRQRLLVKRKTRELGTGEGESCCAVVRLRFYRRIHAHPPRRDVQSVH